MGCALLLTGASKSPKASYLSSLENKVVAEQNLARTDPKGYAKYLRRHRATFRGNMYKDRGGQRVQSKEGVKAVDEAIRFLEKQKPLEPLKPSKALSLAAEDHVKDTGRKNLTGHTGSDDSQPSDRVERHGTWKGMVSENISYGLRKARDIVMQLIIDDGVPDRGHRTNIFTPGARYTGVNCGLHREYKRMCVIVYAGGIEEGGRAK